MFTICLYTRILFISAFFNCFNPRFLSVCARFFYPFISVFSICAVLDGVFYLHWIFALGPRRKVTQRSSSQAVMRHGVAVSRRGAAWRGGRPGGIRFSVYLSGVCNVYLVRP